jgi:hypothetical protein
LTAPVRLFPLAVIPKAQFTVKPWSGKPDPVLPCQTRSKAGEKPPTIPELTVGMLTHEPKSMRDSLATYDKLGLFDVVEVSASSIILWGWLLLGRRGCTVGAGCCRVDDAPIPA